MIQEVTTGAKALTARKYTKWHQTHYKEFLFTATYTLCFWFWGYEVTYPASNKEQPICYIRGSPTESLGHLHLRAATAALRMRFHLPAQYNEQWFTGSELVPSHSFIFCGQTSSVRLLITFLTSWGYMAGEGGNKGTAGQKTITMRFLLVPSDLKSCYRFFSF